MLVRELPAGAMSAFQGGVNNNIFLAFGAFGDEDTWRIPKVRMKPAPKVFQSCSDL